MPQVNQEILKWARETAGLKREEAVEKLGLNGARGVMAVDRLSALEAGEVVPSRPLLIKMSKVYHRPLLTFYLEAPPRKVDRGEDFRTLPADYPASSDALLDALIRDVRARQSIVRAAMEDEDEAEPRRFIASMRRAQGVHTVAESMRQTLGFFLEEYRRQRTPEDAFALLRNKAEAVGVFVLLAGNLGSHHTEIDLETFRGFVIADPVAPFIVINDQDAKPAWSFTLLHELAHLWLGQTGISGVQAERDAERFCNDVASELLLPGDEIRQLKITDATSLKDALELIGRFAGERHLSRSMVAYKLYQIGSIRQAKWREVTAVFRKQWMADKAARRERAKETDDTGPSYYVVRRHRLGAALINLVRRMTSSGALATSKAAKVLGVRPKNVHLVISTPRRDRRQGV